MAVVKGVLGCVLVLTVIICCEAFVPTVLPRSGLSQWNPLSDLWQDPFRILEQNPLSGLAEEIVEISPTRVDWKETPQAHIIKIDVPGIKKEDLKIEYKGDVLTISGERKKEELEKSDHWHRVERAMGKFVRQFRLANGQMDAIKAELDNGVLVVTVPKVESKAGEAKLVSIESGGSGVEKKCVEGEDKVCKA